MRGARVQGGLAPGTAEMQPRDVPWAFAVDRAYRAPFRAQAGLGSGPARAAMA